jgi:vancomycin resistance protein YoaR
LALALIGGWAPASTVSAEELSRFSCERPQPWETGALHNVSVAAGLVDAVVLAPGAVFSFNQTMRSPGGRFVEGTSFLGGLEVKSRGGGICQVSSGLYNAALLAGLEVLERSGHSLYDPSEAYVPAGRDAMVSREGHSDFRFRNSTGEPLTIQARAEGGRLTVSLVGHERRPRTRWIETTLLRRSPARLRQVESGALAFGQCSLLHKGFDGLTVSSRLCWVGPDSVTRCAELGLDRYDRVDEVWRVGAGHGEGKP